MCGAPLYPPGDIRVVEAMARQRGVDLMERAARAVHRWVETHFAAGASILVAAGPGNNGGDALLAACLLARSSFNVHILLPETPRQDEAIAAHRRACEAGLPLSATLPDGFPAPDLVIDGLFGIGLARPLDGRWAEVLRQLAALNAPVLALDAPSGLDAWTGKVLGPCLAADHTLTFLCHKPGLYTADGADFAGNVELANLDCPPEWFPAPAGALNAPAAHLLKRRANSHKGSHGTVVIEGGAPGMTGAALLAGRAALAAGAGKVHVRFLGPAPHVDPAAPELMLAGAEGAPPASAVLAVGPGLGPGDTATQRVELALETTLPLVLDADALNAIASNRELAARLVARASPTVITPHPAEAARLLGCGTGAVQDDRPAAVTALARRFGCHAVLKGSGTLIGRPDGFFLVNTSGGPALAAAGQGDVLTGLIAALIAQGMTVAQASALAVHCHGLAGDDYTREAGGPLGLTASMTVQRLGRVLNRLIG
ncbi:NAD(P)H-hydrate dehydratase [Paludibacterium paludis]|uniref:Bifunctional NAD(P)H-hydrate repair enzyme n=1 Tax=Paludibacterium paludis TaxID=1225769 RepID=A0A918U6E5_9NEIS|nr:NAD(P)H-hydrate dehydratase [Paludibacterium paludis]GGY02570.1 bifunctional NAD(P)H-hydrate repair enzyme [Paludibacterium paludis]